VLAEPDLALGDCRIEWADAASARQRGDAAMIDEPSGVHRGCREPDKSEKPGGPVMTAPTASCRSPSWKEAERCRPRRGAFAADSESSNRGAADLEAVFDVPVKVHRRCWDARAWRSRSTHARPRNGARARPQGRRGDRHSTSRPPVARRRRCAGRQARVTYRDHQGGANLMPSRLPRSTPPPNLAPARGSPAQACEHRRRSTFPRMLPTLAHAPRSRRDGRQTHSCGTDRTGT